MYTKNPDALGSGAFAKVYLGRRNKTGEVVAIKVIDKGVKLSHAINECEVCSFLSLVPLRNIVRILNVESRPTANHFEIYMEPLNGGELFTRIINAKKFSERDAAVVMQGIFSGLLELHTVGRIIHSDLKPENVVFIDPSPESAFKIVDFGLSILVSDRSVDINEGVKSNDLVGTYGYMSPETIREHRYSAKSDMWSAGTILYCLLSGSLPFNIEDKEYKDKVMRGRYFSLESRYWSHVSESAKDLVRCLLRVDPHERFSASEAMNHPWISKYRTVAPNVDFGPAYVKRLQRMSAKQRFRKVVNGIIWTNRVRKASIAHALESLKLKTDHDETPSSARSGCATVRRSLSDCDKLFSINELVNLKKKFLYGARMRHSGVEGNEELVLDDADEENANYLQVGVDYDIFCDIVKSVGLDMLAKPIIFELFDEDKNGRVDYREFLLTLASFKEFNDMSTRLLFDMLDSDGNGRLSLEELEYLLGTILSLNLNNVDGNGLGDQSPDSSALHPNPPPTPSHGHNMEADHHSSHDVLAMFEEMDTNKDGEISFVEFDSWVSKNFTLLKNIFIDPINKY